MSNLAKLEESNISYLQMPFLLPRPSIRTKESIPQILEKFLTYRSQLSTPSESLTEL